MKKNILILGATGMLGMEVLRSFQSINNVNIYASYRKKQYLKNLNKKKTTFFKFDVDHTNILKRLSKKKILVINCIGIIKPFINESDSNSIFEAIKVNTNFPHMLKKIFLKKKGNKIYQIATDCVYSGNKGNYLESSAHDCTDVYGKTKSLGEVVHSKFYNIRCSIIGPEIKNKVSLLEWFKSQKKGSNLTGFANHSWNGLTTHAYAEALRSIIVNRIKIPNDFHLLPKKKISKYELLLEFKKKFLRNDLKIKKINHSFNINRTLNSKYKKINQIIWKQSKYSAVPTIQQMVSDL